MEEWWQRQQQNPWQSELYNRIKGNFDLYYWNTGNSPFVRGLCSRSLCTCMKLLEIEKAVSGCMWSINKVRFDITCLSFLWSDTDEHAKLVKIEVWAHFFFWEPCSGCSLHRLWLASSWHPLSRTDVMPCGIAAYNLYRNIASRQDELFLGCQFLTAQLKLKRQLKFRKAKKETSRINSIDKRSQKTILSSSRCRAVTHLLCGNLMGFLHSSTSVLWIITIPQPALKCKLCCWERRFLP